MVFFSRKMHLKEHFMFFLWHLKQIQGFMLGILKTDWLALGLKDSSLEQAQSIYIRVASSELMADKDFVMQAIDLIANPGFNLTEDRRDFWDMLSEGLKADKDVLMALLKKLYSARLSFSVFFVCTVCIFEIAFFRF